MVGQGWQAPASCLEEETQTSLQPPPLLPPCVQTPRWPSKKQCSGLSSVMKSQPQISFPPGTYAAFLEIIPSPPMSYPPQLFTPAPSPPISHPIPTFLGLPGFSEPGRPDAVPGARALPPWAGTLGCLHPDSCGHPPKTTPTSSTPADPKSPHPTAGPCSPLLFATPLILGWDLGSRHIPLAATSLRGEAVSPSILPHPRRGPAVRRVGAGCGGRSATRTPRWLALSLAAAPPRLPRGPGCQPVGHPPTQLVPTGAGGVLRLSSLGCSAGG